MISVLYPVIRPVPPDIRHLTGRERVLSLSRFARTCAEQSARRSGFGAPVFEKDENGAPLPHNGIYWSVSHKPEMAAGVVSTAPVGIDIEKICPVTPALFRRIITAPEAALFGRESTDRIFVKGFTAKEAVLKCLGIGLTGMGRVRIARVTSADTLEIESGDRRFPVRFFGHGDHMTAVVSNDRSVCWRLQS